VKEQFKQKIVLELKKADSRRQFHIVLSDKAEDVVNNRLYVTNFQPDVAKTDDDDKNDGPSSLAQDLKSTHETYGFKVIEEEANCSYDQEYGKHVIDISQF
jgi:uncharacterized protein (UPF0210 family)